MKGLGKGKSTYEVAYGDQYWPGVDRTSVGRENLGGGGGGIDQISRGHPECTPDPESGTWADVVRKKHKKSCGCKEHAVAYVGRQEDTGINAIEESSGVWERIPIKIDSGAIDTVIPKNVGTYFPIRETEASKSGIGFRAANGSHITNHGERKIEGLGEEWNPIGLRAQVADVKTAL